MRSTDGEDGKESGKPSTLDDTLSKLREIADGGGKGDVERSQNLAALTRHIVRLRPAATIQSNKAVTVRSLACASAGVIAILKILSEYFQ